MLVAALSTLGCKLHLENHRSERPEGQFRGSRLYLHRTSLLAVSENPDQSPCQPATLSYKVLARTEQLGRLLSHDERERAFPDAEQRPTANDFGVRWNPRKAVSQLN